MRDYSIIPLEINKYSDLDDFDEYEAKEAGWPPALISAAIHEIHRREMEPSKRHYQEWVKIARTVSYYNTVAHGRYE